MLVGLYVRLTISETPVFLDALNRSERVKVPMLVVFRDHPRTLFLGVLVSLTAFVSFYLMAVFTLSWGTVGRDARNQRHEPLTINAETAEHAETTLLCEFSEFRVDSRRAL